MHEKSSVLFLSGFSLAALAPGLPPDNPSRFRPCLRLVVILALMTSPSRYFHSGLPPYKFAPMLGAHLPSRERFPAFGLQSHLMQNVRPHRVNEPPTIDQRKTGLDDPRALDILTTEHWSLLSARSLGYQEMFGRATVFIGVLSGTVIALALLAQATQFGRQTLSFAAVLFAVSLFIGIATFVRCVSVNLEDARWVMGMSLIRSAYLQIVPELEQFFVASHAPGVDLRTLGYGSPQRFGNLINSLTTTSSVVAALNSVLAGSLACDVGTLADLALTPCLAIGAGVSLVSAVLHIRYAARFRRQHEPTMKSPS